MDKKGRKLFRRTVGAAIAAMLLSGFYPVAAMAGEIGLIHTKEPLDILTDAADSSESLGKVVDGAHVKILERQGAWVRVQAGTLIGWVPEEFLTETELSVEEAAEANREIIAGIAEEGTAAEEITAEENTAEEIAAEGTAVGETAAEEITEEEIAAKETAVEETAAEEIAAEETVADGTAAKQQDEAPEGEESAAEKTESMDGQPVEVTGETEAQQAEEVLLLQQAEAQRQAEEALRLQQEEAQRQAEEALRLQQEEAQRQAEEAARQQEEAVRRTILEMSGATADDLYLLANIIYCEAGCESYTGKVAVGSVVMNRVRDADYPNTIQDVIYDKGQFSPVRNGSLKRAMKVNKADAWCYQAALEALAGSKPVGDCLYFRRVNGRSGLVLGHHVFY